MISFQCKTKDIKATLTKLKGVQAGIYTYKISYKIKEIDKRVSVTGQVNLIR